MGAEPDAATHHGVSARATSIFILDSLLLIAFILLLSPRMTGLPRHELLGVAFILPVIVHLIIARPWIRGAAKDLTSARHPRTRINFILNALLFVLIVAEIFSGLEISQVLLPSMGWLRVDDRAWRQLHNEFLNWVRLFVAVHVAVNWNWIMGTLRRLSSAASRRITFAPTHVSALLWAIVILLIAMVEMVAIYRVLGHPTIARLYPQNEIARFRPTLGHALLQFFGQSMMIGVIVYAARRWLRVRI